MFEKLKLYSGILENMACVRPNGERLPHLHWCRTIAKETFNSYLGGLALTQLYTPTGRPVNISAPDIATKIFFRISTNCDSLNNLPQHIIIIFS